MQNNADSFTHDEKVILGILCKNREEYPHEDGVLAGYLEREAKKTIADPRTAIRRLMKDRRVIEGYDVDDPDRVYEDLPDGIRDGYGLGPERAYAQGFRIYIKEGCRELCRTLGLAEVSPNTVNDQSQSRIPGRHRTLPMPKRALADLWGGDVTVKKVTNMITSGVLRVEQMTRQNFIFDKRDLPQHVIRELDKIR